MNGEAVEDLLHSRERLQGGSEHRVARLRHEERVLKVADTGALAVESLFSYLSDLLLSNYYFDDDLQLMGCYKRNGKVYIVTSQPYVDGHHPTWEELKAGLASQGLTVLSPHSRNGTFII